MLVPLTLVVIRPPTGLPRILSRYKGQFRDINLSELEKLARVFVYMYTAILHGIVGRPSNGK